MARVAVYECTQVPHAMALAPGQVGLFPIVSPLREQSQEILGYARGLCQHPAVKRHVADITSDAIAFKTGLELRVSTCDAVALSGPTAIGGALDEVAKWPGEESKVPDREILASFEPSMAPVVGAPPRRLLAITSAYLTEGLAFETEQANWGKADGDWLSFRGETPLYNPAISLEWLEKQRGRTARQRALYDREFRCIWQPSITDGFFDADAIANCTDKGRTCKALPQRREGIRYTVATDAAFGRDLFGLAVAHKERRPNGPPVLVVDHIEAWKPPAGGKLSPEDVVAKVARIAKHFGARSVVVDQFSAATLEVLFRQYGLATDQQAWTSVNKPARFRAVRDLMLDGLVRLPADEGLATELANIRSRMRRDGGEAIEAARGSDDRVFAMVLALSEAMQHPAGEAATPASFEPLRQQLAKRWKTVDLMFAKSKDDEGCLTREMAPGTYLRSAA